MSVSQRFECNHLVDSVRRAAWYTLWGCVTWLVTSTATAQTETQKPIAEQSHWCAPELTIINDNVCYFAPSQGHRGTASTEPPHGTLVIFLHSLISAGPTAAWEQQRRMLRLANTYGFAMLVPRGRPGLGPGRDPSVLAWPTAQSTQQLAEEELLAEWRAAIVWATKQHGAFERTLMFGFSNGAYYATSLTFRERFPVDGVAVFAGGSTSKYQRINATRAKLRTPLFVGYGKLDPDRPQQKQLVEMLRSLRWPHSSLQSNVGHTVSGEQLAAALRFLGHRVSETR